VTGKQGNTYRIIDPAEVGTTLADYGGAYQTRGSVKDPNGDVSELDFALGDAADLLISAATGESTGLDLASGTIVQHIPRSAYFRDALTDDVSGEPPTDESHLVEIFQPPQGNYQVVVNGLKLGNYSLSVRAFAQDGSMEPSIDLPGVAGPASLSTFQIQFSSAPGSLSTAVRTATFETTLGDINSSLQLGLIDNAGIANALSSKIEAAMSAALQRQGKTARNILNAFKNQVSAQDRKHITGVAAQILQEDADWLIRQCP
jgi:hypothetical protein